MGESARQAEYSTRGGLKFVCRLDLDVFFLQMYRLQVCLRVVDRPAKGRVTRGQSGNKSRARGGRRPIARD